MNSFYRFWHREAKYLLAYLVIILPFLSVYLRGSWAFLAPAVFFGLVPLLELVLKGNEENFESSAEKTLLNNRFYDFLLYLNLPLLYGLLIFYFHTLSQGSFSAWEHIGMAISVGISCGAIGINVGHELGHRNTKHERLIAQGLLLGSLYMHFFIEHNRGHHRHVATPKDPASAKMGELVYTFWIKSIVGGYLSAWRLERSRLEKAGKKAFSIQNQMLQFQLIQLLAIVSVAFFFSPEAMLAYLIVSLFGILLLETVNYLEHYGLRRKEIRPGVYEPVNSLHSWNSNHTFGRILLYELTRHADHHYRASRKFQILRHHEDSPELPTGYPGMVLLSLIPPLWFRTMNPRVKAFQASGTAISPS